MSSIYVSNLDENVTEAQLSTHFSKFGFITECKMGKLEDGRCKGYAKLTTNDASALRIILNTDHIFASRKARVERYIQEQDRAHQKDLEIVQRRICVLGVPKGLKDPEFKQVFSYFGDVENGYIRENKHRKKNHGFVTFVQKSSAEKALLRKYLDIEGWGRVQIREFRSKALIKRQKREQAKKHPTPQVSPRDFAGRSEREDIHRPFIPVQNQGGFTNRFELPIRYNSSSFDSNFTDDSIGSSGYRKRASIVSNKPRFEDSYTYQFMNSTKLKKYIEKIIEENPLIEKIQNNQKKMLELFYFNKKNRYESEETGALYNYDCVARRFAKRVYRNHYRSNLRLNDPKKPKNSQHFDHSGWSYPRSSSNCWW